MAYQSQLEAARRAAELQFEWLRADMERTRPALGTLRFLDRPDRNLFGASARGESLSIEFEPASASMLTRVRHSKMKDGVPDELTRYVYFEDSESGVRGWVKPDAVSEKPLGLVADGIISAKIGIFRLRLGI